MQGIRKTFFNLSKYFEPTNVDDKAEARRNSAILFGFTLLYVPMLTTFAIVTVVLLGHLPLVICELFSAAMIFFGVFCYKFTGRYILSANIMMTGGVFLIMAASVFTNGIYSPVLFWSSIAPMSAGMITGRRSVFAWWAVLIVTFLGFYLFRESISTSPFLITDENLLGHLRMRVVFGSITLTSAITFLYITLIQKNVDHAEESEEKVRNLLKIVSHDISTPLMVIGSLTKRLRGKNSLSDEDAVYMEKIEGSYERITQILEKVREMEALHSGKFEVEMQSVSLQSCLNEALSAVDERLEHKNVKVFVDSSIDSDLTVLADPIILSQQVLPNILTNAIKFSESGGQIFIQASEEKSGRVELTVQDFGVGMPEVILDKIFDMAESTSRVGTDGEKGTGFGMPLVKLFMESFGGNVEIESQVEGKTGTTVKLEFLSKESQEEAA